MSENSDRLAPPSAVPRFEPLRFKFKPLNAKGKETGFWSKKGELAGDELVLAGSRIPLLSIAKTAVRLNRLMLVVGTASGPATLMIAITTRAWISKSTQGNEAWANQIKQTIDRFRSACWAERRRAALKTAGTERMFRTEPCPCCAATVDLSDFQESPQMYCPYCDTVATLGADRPKDESMYRLCDACGYYGRPVAFTSTYIVFLVVAGHISYRRTSLCHACMRAEAWKMFFGNLVFVVGVPLAIGQLLRAHLGGSTFSAAFAGLEAANYAARRKNYDKADRLYQEILDRVPHAAGVRYNRARIRSAAGDDKGCLDEVTAALADCANYQPAVELAANTLHRLGRHGEAEMLKKQWGAAG